MTTLLKTSALKRSNGLKWLTHKKSSLEIPKKLLRQSRLNLPACSELQVVRHYTRLSQKNFSIDSHFYPLGSCTMKYNPKIAHQLASLPGFINRHPLAPIEFSQGYLNCAYELQQWLAELTGMAAVSLTGMAGAQGEFAGVAMIKKYHESRGDFARVEMIVPDAAHGTNPASAVLCGLQVKEVATDKEGNINLDQLKSLVGPKTAGIMLTNPSTLGVFEANILELSDLIHAAGGLLYYDGANLNAILGHVRPGDMGFDVMHLNLHKTFATPHGGGGPGCGPIACNQKLMDFLPIPRVVLKNNQYQWFCNPEKSIGRMSTFAGNAGIILRAYIYIHRLGKTGLMRVAQYATLNANYLKERLKQAGFHLAYGERLAAHEFIVSFSKEAKEYQISAKDIAKRLLDYGIHAPTTYFPLLIDECFLIEPTETESKEELDNFIQILIKIREEMKNNALLLKEAPIKTPVKRLDEVFAAKQLDVAYQYKNEENY